MIMIIKMTLTDKKKKVHVRITTQRSWGSPCQSQKMPVSNSVQCQLGISVHNFSPRRFLNPTPQNQCALTQTWLHSCLPDQE